MIMDEFGFKIHSCPKCKSTDVSMDMQGKMTCMKCKYNGTSKVIDGESLLKPFIEMEEQEKKNLEPQVYFQRKEQKKQEKDIPLRNL
jgi:transcription initiation factor TFIIIB Brf1 subunit/transcription initiation factor TFIIB